MLDVPTPPKITIKLVVELVCCVIDIGRKTVALCANLGSGEVPVTIILSRHEKE